MAWRRRRLLVVLGALALLGVACGLVVWLMPPKPGITPANYERIEKGMTRRELEDLLAKPWKPPPCPLLIDGPNMPALLIRAERHFIRRLKELDGPFPHENGRSAVVWVSDRAVIIAVVDDRERLVWKDPYVEQDEDFFYRRQHDGLFDRLRRLLRL